MIAPHLWHTRCIVKKLLRTSPGFEDILEVGCGDAKFLMSLGDFKKRHGIDLSPEALALARALISDTPQVTVEQKDIFDFEREGYDACVALAVLEHIEEDERAMRIIHRLLKNRGLFVFSVPAHVRLYGPADSKSGHYRRYDRQHLDSILSRCGFEIEKLYCLGFPFGRCMFSLYNKFLVLVGHTGKGSFDERTRTSAQSLIQTFPRRLVLMYALYPLFYFLMFVDRIFMKKEWGNYFIGAARKHGAEDLVP